ncbi:NAD(+) diphosphatase [Microbacterium luticocti]|uniref:NAD(+) diphosphatase n=1 Tax=Microbacterium luticocti TaxID=451764 RepID=UPI000408419D|nr:NAD(+) diphosphatase [Microbacterium luticocti]
MTPLGASGDAVAPRPARIAGSSAPGVTAHAGFDPHAAERADPALLTRLRADGRTRVLVVRGDRALVRRGEGTGHAHLHWWRTAQVPGGADWAFLGRGDDGAAILAAVFDAEAGGPADADADGGVGAPADPDVDAGAGEWAALREVGGLLDATEAATLVTAVSLGRWLREAPFCPACGSRTRVVQAGWARVCDGCGREHFPRTDPAVIVAVESATDPDLLLLGSNTLWGPDRYSCFAGFVEAGESAEQAVVRELAEESGVQVRDVRYAGSQAWPYPRSLMLGFRARAADDAAARPDGDEIAAVRWFTREQIGRALAGTADGIRLPGPASIAHRLIAEWHAEAR